MVYQINLIAGSIAGTQCKSFWILHDKLFNLLCIIYTLTRHYEN